MLIEGIGRASPIEEPEACIYGYGAVRFLTNAVISPTASANRNAFDGARDRHITLGRRLAHHGAVPLMVLHLKMINEMVRQNSLTNSEKLCKV